MSDGTTLKAVQEHSEELEKQIAAIMAAVRLFLPNIPGNPVLMGTETALLKAVNQLIGYIDHFVICNESLTHIKDLLRAPIKGKP